ncbi:MAG: hypothetical protein E6F99_16740 [Actinobacteria bacterium]|nr:MAG: hypothetical protein E6F99_16740 [Actinomycetota bacterium]
MPTGSTSRSCTPTIRTLPYRPPSDVIGAWWTPRPRCRTATRGRSRRCRCRARCRHPFPRTESPRRIRPPRRTRRPSR